MRKNRAVEVARQREENYKLALERDFNYNFCRSRWRFRREFRRFENPIDVENHFKEWTYLTYKELRAIKLYREKCGGADVTPNFAEGIKDLTDILDKSLNQAMNSDF